MATSIRVLHVDDDPISGASVSGFLQREDDRFEVLTDSGAAGGLARTEDDQPDCAVGDYDAGRDPEAVASGAISAGVEPVVDRRRVCTRRRSGRFGRRRPASGRRDHSE